MTGAPACVRTGRLDIPGVNRLAHALYAPVLAGQRLPVNLARFLFLDPVAGDFYVDWDKTANDAVAILRGQAGRKQLHHPVAGDLELTYEALELPADPGLTMITYTAEPGSTSQEALDFLASWAATLDQLGQPETAQALEEG